MKRELRKREEGKRKKKKEKKKGISFKMELELKSTIIKKFAVKCNAESVSPLYCLLCSEKDRDLWNRDEWREERGERSKALSCDWWSGTSVGAETKQGRKRERERVCLCVSE